MDSEEKEEFNKLQLEVQELRQCIIKMINPFITNEVVNDAYYDKLTSYPQVQEYCP